MFNTIITHGKFKSIIKYKGHAMKTKNGGLFTSLSDIKKATEARSNYSNKYSNGSVLVIGGSKLYAGAPVLSSFASNAAFSALRTGTGYVTLLVEENIEKVEKSISIPNLIVKSVKDKASSEMYKINKA